MSIYILECLEFCQLVKITEHLQEIKGVKWYNSFKEIHYD